MIIIPGFGLLDHKVKYIYIDRLTTGERELRVTLDRNDKHEEIVLSEVDLRLSIFIDDRQVFWKEYNLNIIQDAITRHEKSLQWKEERTEDQSGGYV